MILNVNNSVCIAFRSLCGRVAKDADRVFATTFIYSELEKHNKLKNKPGAVKHSAAGISC